MTLPTYSTGTASVAAGGTVVTGVGCAWTGINAKQGDFISIGGSDAALITEVTDATHLKVAPWAAGAKTTQSYIIYQNYVGRVVGVAAAEDVGVMLEKLHTDGLPFIVDPGLTVPDPSYGDDGQMAFQPSTGKWWTKTGGVWVSSPGLSSDASKVLKAGDTMSGNLTIDKANPVLNLVKAASGQNAVIWGYKTTLPRWAIAFGDTVPETGSNVGSDWALYNYSDAGGFIGTAMHVNRATGVLSAGRGNFGSPGLLQWQACPLAVETAAAAQFPVSIKGVDRGLQSLVTGATGIFAWFMQGTAANNIGSITGTTTTTFYNTTSDGRRKPIREAFSGLDIINGLNPVRHNWLNEPDQWSYGVIAQEAVDVLPQMVLRGDDDPDKLPGDPGFVGWGADYSQAVPVLIRAVQELLARIEQLEAAAR